MAEFLMALEALSAFEVVFPDLIRAFKALLLLFQKRDKEQAAETLNEVLAAAREACHNVAKLDFGHSDDPVAENLAKFNEAAASLQARYAAINQPLTETQAKTAVQVAYAGIKTQGTS